MIAIIRICGQVKVNKKVKATLERFNLKKKYSCCVVRESKEIEGMLKVIENSVAYGKIDDKTLIELIEKRGKKIDGKEISKKDAEEIAKKFINSKKNEKFSDLGIKNVFRLHPARGGITTKRHFPEGVLGNNKEEITKLIKKML